MTMIAMETTYSTFWHQAWIVDLGKKTAVDWQEETQIESQLPGVIWAGCDLFHTNFKNLDEIPCCAKSKVTVLSWVPPLKKRLP